MGDEVWHGVHVRIADAGHGAFMPDRAHAADDVRQRGLRERLGQFLIVGDGKRQVKPFSHQEIAKGAKIVAAVRFPRTRHLDDAVTRLDKPLFDFTDERPEIISAKEVRVHKQQPSA